MTDKDTKKLIDHYNTWIQEQEQKYRAARISECPYYKINLATYKKFDSEHKKIFKNLVKQPITQSSLWDLWNEILKKGDYKIKQKAETIRGVDYKINKSLYNKLVDTDYLFRFCNNQGLDLSKSHFKWILDQDLIKPIYIKEGEKLYSIYQLITLDHAVQIKKESLKNPEPTFFFSHQIKIDKKMIDSPEPVMTAPIYWQDYILLNKERIINYDKDLKPLILLLEAINNLNYLIRDKTRKEFFKLKNKYPKEKRYKAEDILKSIKDKTFRYYLPRFRSKFKQLPANHIKKWSHSIFPALAIGHNPILQSCNKWPILLKIFYAEENTAQTIFKKWNDIKLANFYTHIIQELNDYLKVAGVKDISSIEDLVSRTSINKEKRCQICGEAFMSNSERNGGKQQFLCGKSGCKKEWDKMRQKKYRDKKR